MFQGFEGAAGTGKTQRLLESAIAAVGRLDPHQRVLALTFMHASRRRLADKFASEPALRRRSVSMTIDGFANVVVRRWRSLGSELNCIAGDFDATCDACGRLLEESDVVNWVAATFPVVIVDEAQELAPVRLRIVRALATRVSIFVAADEFQCLDRKIDTGPFMKWFRSGEVVQLPMIHRTRQKGLLDAASAIRDGKSPRSGTGFDIRYEFPNNMPFKIGHTLNAARQARRSCALIVAPSGKTWANKLVSRLSQGLSTQQQRVPALPLHWEPRAEDEVREVLARINVSDAVDHRTLRESVLAILEPPMWLADFVRAMDRAFHVTDQQVWTRREVADLIERKARLHSAYGLHRRRGIPIMTIHGAKNRQFDQVLVLWPPGVPGEPDDLRRLLYNAVTRAESKCTVFVQSKETLSAPPF